MGSDRARVSYDPSRQWRGLVAQQGRVTLEADWNEAAAIDAERDRLTTLDVVGPLGTPDGGYAVTATPASPPGASPPATGTLSVGTGTLYLGGERLELDGPIVLDGSPQPDWLDVSTDSLFVAPPATGSSPPGSSPGSNQPGSPPGSSNELVYLLAIEQEVSAVEVPELADVAVGGPDTMQRLRVLQRFVRRETAAGDCTEAWKEVQSAWQGIGLELDPTTMQLRSNAGLLVTFDQLPPPTSACEPSATGGYLGPENQLIRIQVTSIDAVSGTPTIVWGFDDASFLYPLQSAIPDASGNLQLTLATAPVDSYHFPVSGQAVELLRDTAALPVPGPLTGSPPSSTTTSDYLASASGFVSPVVTSYDPTKKTLTISGLPPADFVSTGATPQLYLRVWQGSAQAPANSVVELEASGATTGLQVTLSSSGAFHVGDFWRFAVRPSVPQLLYPARIGASAQAPDGPRVWAGPVAFVSWAANGDATVSSCIAAFENLVELSGRQGGCCTVNVTSADVEAAGSLQAVLAPYAGSGALKVCLAPGRYQLAEPLILGAAFEGISIEACGPGVVIEGPAAPTPDFRLGLVVLDGVSEATISGISFQLPLVPFDVAPRTFAGLNVAGVADTNQTLLDEFGRQLDVAIGLAIHQGQGLAITDCSFTLDVPSSSGGLFAAGIVATGQVEQITVDGCSFKAGPAPTRVPYYDLAAGNRPPPPYVLSFGYLQAPSGRPGAEPDIGVLHEARLTGCSFESLTVPVLVMASLGDVRIDSCTVQDCYGGFWLVSLASSGRVFDLIPIGDAAIRSDLVKLGLTALTDGIFTIGSAMVRVLPQSTADIATPRLIPLADKSIVDAASSELQRFFVTTAMPGVASAQAAPPAANAQTGGTVASDLTARIANPILLQHYPNLGSLLGAAGTAAPSVPLAADVGVGVLLRLDVGGCQVDAVVADAYSGAGLVVADLTAKPGSVLLQGSRIRNRFPDGEAALLAGVGESSVTGSIVANEIAENASNLAAGGAATGSAVAFSLVLYEGKVALPEPPVAVVGNVLIGTAILPDRPQSLPAWVTFNANFGF